MSRKKTLFEILDVPADADAATVTAAYARQWEALQAQAGSLSHEDYSYQRALLELARDTLTDPVLRQNYLDKLNAGAAPAPASALPNPALSQEAQALALRADALALKADALMMSQIPPVYTEPPSLIERILESFKNAFRSVLVVLGAILLLSFVSRWAFSAYHTAQAAKIEAQAAKAREQMIIQEYYQRYGERPASAAEAIRLSQIKEKERREQDLAQQELRFQEEQVRRFEEESRRQGQQVSANLRYAEQRAEMEEARKREMEEYRQRQEEARIRMQQQCWQYELRRPPRTGSNE